MKGNKNETTNTTTTNKKNTNQNESLSILLKWFPTIPRNHITIGFSNSIAETKQFHSLFQHKKLPQHGWTDFQIQSLVMTLSSLDTNHISPLKERRGGGEFTGRWCGVGEREGRVYSPLVMNRHFGLSHGIGRSGDVAEPQPKAVGSSIMAELTRCMVLDAMVRGCGLDGSTYNNSKKKKKGQKDGDDDDDSLERGSGGGPVRYGMVLPLCTGMTMSLVLSTLLANDSNNSSNTNTNATASTTSFTTSASTVPIPPPPPIVKKDIVLWSRIDQKSCFKAILSTGLQCIILPTKILDQSTDQVTLDVPILESYLTSPLYRHRILAVLSTTSCFAPRTPDPIDKISHLCQEHSIPHVINNAYGLQDTKTIKKLLNRACVTGRVDAIISSTDKNFMVPVGGAILTSPSESMIRNVGKMYPGRASSAPLFDLFVTLLSMGLEGYREVLKEREELVEGEFGRRLEGIAEKYGEKVLRCPENRISFGITLDTLARDVVLDDDDDVKGEEEDDEADDGEIRRLLLDRKKADVTSMFGSMLFTRCISGTRVVAKHQTKTIGNYEFIGFGSSTNEYPHHYLTAACSIGLGREEMEEFFVRLDKCFKDFLVKRRKEEAKKRRGSS